jgi:hypothetical protein
MNANPCSRFISLYAARAGTLALCVAATLATPAVGIVVPSIESVLVRDDQLDSQPLYTLDFEGNYLPNVVLRENGGASFEALKAQAVAARSFTYYKFFNVGASFLRNSQADQVYSLGGIRPNPGDKWDRAVRETEGEILTFADTITASFYVAGATPSGPSPVAGPSDPDPSNTERFVTYPFSQGLLGVQNTGTPLGFMGTPSNPNFPNRGAMSQNGADFQSDNGTHYYDILKFYYGGDIQLESVTPQPRQSPFGRKPLASFDRNNATFVQPLTFSGQTDGLGSGTSVERVSTGDGGFAQRLTFDYDPALDAQGDGFFARHVSGASRAREALTSGTVVTGAASPVGNVILPTRGTIGFSLLAEPGSGESLSDLFVSIVIDDLTAGSDWVGTEQSYRQRVLADGMWRSYEWELSNAAFSSFLNVGDGLLSDRFSLDSIVFEGVGDAVVLLDDVFYDPLGVVIPEPSTAVLLLGLGLALTLTRVRSGAGRRVRFAGAGFAPQAMGVDAGLRIGDGHRVHGFAVERFGAGASDDGVPVSRDAHAMKSFEQQGVSDAAAPVLGRHAGRAEEATGGGVVTREAEQFAVAERKDRAGGRVAKGCFELVGPLNRKSLGDPAADRCTLVGH